MTEQKTRETLEDEWWDRWWTEDYSWNGLARQPLGGSYFGEERRGAFGEKSLQEYWRREPDSEKTRTDEELLAAGELTRAPDGALWHIVHVPITWKDRTRAKSNWNNETKRKLSDTLQLRLLNTDDSFIDASHSDEILDGRAQFSGAVLTEDFLLKLAGDTSESVQPTRIVCRQAWIKLLIASEAEFSDEVEFSNVFFSGAVSFYKAVFHRNLELRDAIFGGEAWFFKAEFMENAYFSRAKVFGNFMFQDTKIHGAVNFYDASLCGESNFANTEFYGNAWFMCSKFLHSGTFERAHFHANASFARSKFLDDPYFDEAIFDKDVYFDFSDFAKKASFTGASFAGQTSFRGVSLLGGALFEEVKQWGDKLNWSRAFFDSKTSGTLSFERSPLPPLSAFHGLKLDNGALLSFDDPGTMATLASFSEQLSSIKDTKENASGSKEKISPDHANRLLDDLAGGCRVLKKYFESQGDRERSQRFFRLELEARMKSDDVGRLGRELINGIPTGVQF
ncbi:MAG: pentapeptide repeat-containing protein [Roseomonas sp.]|nr:pentapeptide repeat-containing protein [Roseomonas sp.]MCA3341530.1 pentapeptide repeat-containing protein [Roseomonas sp.]